MSQSPVRVAIPDDTRAGAHRLPAFCIIIVVPARPGDYKAGCGFEAAVRPDQQDERPPEPYHGLPARERSKRLRRGWKPVIQRAWDSLSGGRHAVRENAAYLISDGSVQIPGTGIGMGVVD